jgi:hypothetical protein
MKAWRDQLEIGVKKLEDQAGILQGLIKIQQGNDVGDTRTFTPGASVKALEAKLDHIRTVLEQVQQDAKISKEEAN